MSLFVEGVLRDAGVYYHGSSTRFLEFENVNNKMHTEYDMPVWFFTQDLDYARRYGKYIYTVELSVRRTFDATKPTDMRMLKKYVREFGGDIEEVLDEQFYKGLPYWTCADAFYAAVSNGFDSIWIQEELEGEVVSIGVFDKSNIKILSVEESLGKRD